MSGAELRGGQKIFLRNVQSIDFHYSICVHLSSIFLNSYTASISKYAFLFGYPGSSFNVKKIQMRHARTCFTAERISMNSMF